MSRRVVVVMGPSGCGKSTVGHEVAELWRATFVEGDDAHGEANREKMRAGTALTDADRRSWTRAIGAAVKRAEGERAVLACSALNERVRSWLREELPGACGFVLLDVPPEVLAQRLSARRGHFAGPALLESQLAALHVPDGAVRVDGTLPAREAARRVLAAARTPGFFGPASDPG